ncbi:relaxase/mobilization nuclease domain-containing protein, partial [Pseudochrobactrum saccharolyticum]|uniref:relaxase/mobilization nuclease domain-containing protein n=1 Tax=Pseudochrobactrum saccharolyticum TaxID=354352 RepID=UPI00275A15FD|nr:hypothetical protein [Pseudochrobactrum saccharolyticum]
MIGQVVRHGKTKKDAKNLYAHLMKGAGTRFEVLNSAAPNLSEAMADMMIARDGSRAEAAFLHIAISPSRDMSDDELHRVCDIVMRHFSAEENQAVLVIHEKERVNDSGNRHAHLVLGRVGPDGAVLQSGFDKIKLETAMRIAEFEMSEPSVLGRHHTSAIKWLRAHGRNDVADYMCAAHSETPMKPTSSVSPASRQMIEKKIGNDLSSLTDDIRSAWSQSDNGQSFAAALSEKNYAIEKGQKDGVFLVMKDGVQLGALDRLLKEKRAAVKSKMGDFEHDAIQSNASNESHIQRVKSEPARSRGIETIVATPGAERSDRGRSDRTDSRSTQRHSVESEAHYDSGGGLRKKSRSLDKKSALIRLDKVRLSASSAISVQDIKTKNVGKPVSKFEANLAIYLIEAHKKGWHWIKEYKDDLIQKIKDFQSRLSSRSAIPERSMTPVSNKEPV